MHSMTFAQRRNRLTTHFSERIPVYKYTMMCQSNTTNFYYVYYCIRATCFYSYRIIFRPFKGNRSLRRNV